MNAQREVVDAIAARGYRGDWNPTAFGARQAAKLQEELAEAVECYTWGWRGLLLRFVIALAASVARWYFDNWQGWEQVRCKDIEKLKGEIADAQVVVFCWADAVIEMTARPFSSMWAAVKKSTADVERDVR